MEVVKLSELQENFNSVSQNSPYQIIIIENEIDEVMKYVTTIPPVYGTRHFKEISKPRTTYMSNRIFNLDIHDRVLFSKAFSEIMYTGDFKLESTNIENYKTIEQAKELFEYYLWLRKLLKERQSTPQKTEKKSPLTHKQKMLALYYLGLDFRKFKNNKQSAIILSKILDLDFYNTKENLTYFDGINCEVKTEDNIKATLELFEHKDFKEIHTRIKKDIEK